jgi:CHAD domain-containing protein
MPGPVRRSNLLKYRLGRFTRVLPDVEKGDVRSLHRARVASRRLRELVPVLQLEPAITRKLTRRLRKVTRQLGRVRELDVLLLLVDELRISQPVHRDALKRIEVAVAKSRDEARKGLLEHLPAGDMWRTARKLSRAFDQLRETEQNRAGARLPKAAAWAIDARVANRGARLRAAMQDAGAMYLPERLHAVRIALKKLRYALELSVAVQVSGRKGASRADQRAPLRTLKRVQDTLGRMHDLQVLIDRVRQVQASVTLPALSSWRELDMLVVTLEEMCRRLHARYVRDRDGVEAIANRLYAPRGTSAPRTEQHAG